MNALFDASPSTGAARAQPLTAVEIDAHPDADRIWATICDLRESVRDNMERLEDLLDKAREVAWNNGRKNAEAFLRKALEKPECETIPYDLRDMLVRSAGGGQP